jgi:YidC/Oxa1 family membrane protein insertase
VFEALIVQPIFNLLVLIYALLPGHNFGISIVVFTIVIRLFMWPLVKKQLHQTKLMRELQPELKRIKQAANGNRQQESLMQMELYKERGINPFSSIGVLAVQLVILIGLYSGLIRVVNDPVVIVDFAYGWLQNIGFMKELAEDITKFDNTLFGLVDLSRAAIGSQGFYFPAFLLVVGSAIAQFYQSKQLMPNDKDARGLKQILKEASEGKQTDAQETNAAVMKGMRYFIPIMIFFVAMPLASAISLYWFVGSLVGYIQQSIILKQDDQEMDIIARSNNTKDKKEKKNNIIEGEVVSKSQSTKTPQKTKKKSSTSKKKRRKK